jgi:hypothetical protein
MRKLYSGFLATAIGICSMMPLDAAFAQKGPSETSTAKPRTKTVRDCEYDVLPGLAEITSIQVTRPASESSLKYDEHEVLFKFTPMEGGQILEMLRDSEIEFVLRSRAIRIPVGPEYIKAKNLKVGTKYAMNLLQTENKDACLERYTYESKALDNDLFEAYEYIIDYTKEAYVRQLEEQDRNYERKKAAGADATVAATVDPTIETKIEPIAKGQESLDYGGLTPEEIANLSEAEMRALVEENLRKKLESGGTTTYGGSELGINEDEMRKEIEAKYREEHADEIAAAEGGDNSVAPKTTSTSSNAAATDAIKEAKRKAKEAEKEAAAQKKREEQEAIERQKKEDEIRAKIEKEIADKVQKEIAEKEAAAKAAAEAKVLADQEDAAKKTMAMDKMKAIEKEMSQRIIDETKRKECVFGDRISGTIEVVKVSKVKEAEESYLKYAEYEVLVAFHPDNDANKKDKKLWETNYTFTLDPTGQNANPGANYIRKYKVFKASKYQGFAQVLTTGICNSVMIYSPDLPNDNSKIKLN